MKTQVAIIGGGPAGLLLARILHQHNIACVVLERQSREYVLSRIRAGVLEWGSVEVLRNAGVGERMDQHGHPHDVVGIAYAGRDRFDIDTFRYAGRKMMAYGQTQITEDLYAALDTDGTLVLDEATDVALHDIEAKSPYVTFTRDGEHVRLDCDFIAGCDGSHGVSRLAIPADKRREYEKLFPFGWLGIMSETPPYPDIVYANSPRGFALASMRSPMLSRYYIQCEVDARIEDWPDERFWEELKRRFPADIAASLVTGPSIEKSIAPLRSFVSEPMSYGRLYLAGDASHQVPPTGAKGLNLAISDVHYLSRAFATHYHDGSDERLEHYSDVALRRVWGAVRFSWWLTALLHTFPDSSDFDHRIQVSELEFIASSEQAKVVMCSQYAGLPFED